MHHHYKYSLISVGNKFLCVADLCENVFLNENKWSFFIDIFHQNVPTYAQCWHYCFRGRMAHGWGKRCLFFWAILIKRLWTWNAQNFVDWSEIHWNLIRIWTTYGFHIEKSFWGGRNICSVVSTPNHKITFWPTRFVRCTFIYYTLQTETHHRYLQWITFLDLYFSHFKWLKVKLFSKSTNK